MLGLFKSKEKTDRVRILIVDDEPDLVDTIQCRLEHGKYDAITAANGKDGLEKAANEKPDLILLDTNMPVMNGHEMLERLRKSPELKNIPVIKRPHATVRRVPDWQPPNPFDQSRRKIVFRGPPNRLLAGEYETVFCSPVRKSREWTGK